MNKCTCYFCEAGKAAAAAGQTAVYRKPRPAVENTELTEALKRMRQMAAHNYPSKTKSNGGNKNGYQGPI